MGVGTIRTLDFYRYDLNTFLRSRFARKNIKFHGTPRTPKTISIASISDAVYERLRTSSRNMKYEAVSIDAATARIAFFAPLRDLMRRN